MKKILSIDDEPLMLRCLESALAGEGYSIRTTSDPDEFLQVLRQDTETALVLLDVKMPNRNGFDLYREVRSIRKVPVLFVTAYPKSFTANDGEVRDLWIEDVSDGTTDIIYKPFTFDELIEKVQGLIGTAIETEPVDDESAGP